MMTDTPRADALLTDLISGDPHIEDLASLTEAHEREKALHVLLALLTDPDPRLRACANKALGVMGDRRAVELLLSTFRQQGNWPHVSKAKFEALVALRDPDAILPLLVHYGLQIRDRDRLLNAFDRFDQRDVARILGDATGHDVESIREAALSFLNMRDDPRIYQFLIKALDDESVTIRRPGYS